MGPPRCRGSALAVKPVLSVQDGQVEPLERVRAAARAIARLQALTETDRLNLADWADDVDIAVQHIDAEERAHGLAQVLAAPGDDAVTTATLSAVVAAHVGLGDDRRRPAPADQGLTLHRHQARRRVIHTLVARLPPAGSAA